MTDSTPDDTAAELEKLRAKNRELLAENRQLKDSNSALTANTTAQAARLQRYELDAPIEHTVAEVAMPKCAELWRLAFERHFQFRPGAEGVEILTRDGEPAMLPAQPNVKGREKPRVARLEPRDLVELIGSLPEFAAITVGSRASGGGAAGSHPARGVSSETRSDSPEKGRETPAAAPLGLR